MHMHVLSLSLRLVVCYTGCDQDHFHDVSEEPYTSGTIFFELPGKLSPDAISFHEWSSCSNIFLQDMHYSNLYEYTS
jgi:hypothetical protein